MIVLILVANVELTGAKRPVRNEMTNEVEQFVMYGFKTFTTGENNMKKTYKFDAGFDISVTIEADTEKLTPEVAEEINSFWMGAKDVLRAANGDVTEAAVRWAASRFIRALLGGCSVQGAQAELENAEGWPDDHGIKLLHFELPDFAADELELAEST